jgi:hypothetical protein
MLNMPWFIWLNVIAILVLWGAFWLARKFSQPPHLVLKIVNRFMFIMALVLLILNWNPSWMLAIQPAIKPLLYLFLLIVTWEVISTLLEIVGIVKADADDESEGEASKQSEEEAAQYEPEEKALLQASHQEQGQTQASNFDTLTDLDDDATYTAADTHTQPIKDPLQAEKEFASSIKTVFSPQSTDSERLQHVSKLLTSDDDDDVLDEDDDSKLVDWAILGFLVIALGMPFYVALKYTLI